MRLAEGVAEEKALREGGFTDEEVTAWKAETTQDLVDAGFSGQEVGAYFGDKVPDMEPVKAHIQENIKKGMEGLKTETGEVKELSFFDALNMGLNAGWESSVSGLISRGKNPETILPEHMPMAMRIASNAATMAGDLPWMAAGAIAGKPVGTALGAMAAPAPGVGAVSAAVGGQIGSTAGAFALPAAMRQYLMDKYAKGEVKDFSDFWERTAAILYEGLKGGATGALTGGAGAAAGAATWASGPLAHTTSVMTSELATMVTVGKALEGEAPHPQDFIDGAILLGGVKFATGTAGKLRNIYAKTGVRPEEVVERAQTDPVLRQELLSSNVETPKAFGKMEVEPPKVEEKPLELDPPKRSDAESKILSQVGEKAPPEGKKYTPRDFYKDFVDKLDPVNEAIKTLEKDPKSLPAAENPYVLTRMANDYKAKTKHVMEHGTLDFQTLARTGKGLKEITAPFRENPEGFEAYLISKRALEVEGRGLTSGFDLESAKAVIKEGKEKYEKAALELVEFQNANLKYVRDAGLLTEKSYKAMVEMGKSYLPFSRILEPTEGGGKKPGKASSLKAFTGSDKKIQRPFLSILENTETLIRLAEKNRATEKLISLAESVPGQEVFRKVETPLKPIEVKADEVNRALREQGIEVDAESFQIFRAQSKNLGPNEFQVFRNGKREVYETTPEIAGALKSLDGDATAGNVFLRLAGKFTAAKKLGIALTPEFITKNLFRDQLTAGVFSQGGSVPFRDMLVAMGDIVKKNDHYYNWLKSGGANGTFLELGSRYLEKDVFGLNREVKFLDRVQNVVSKPVQIMQVAGSVVESATRLAEFKAVSKGAASGPKVFEGGFAAREVTVDFARVGAKVSALNSITAFMNVGIQGLDRTVRAMKDDPVGVTTRATAAITVPSVLLWWANKDDPRWKDIPRWQKDTFWIVMTDDHIYRIPKPQELGILFGSVPERVLEAYFADNPNAAKDFDETMMNLVTPSFLPDAVSPMVEHYFNKSIFRDAPLVPQALEGILPEYQYTEYTSETAKALGKLIATYVPGQREIPGEKGGFASPAVIENYVRAWTGSLGGYALMLADKSLTAAGVVPDPVKPASTLADLPVIKAFVIRHPSATAQSIQDFYDNFSKSEVVAKTISNRAKQGDFDSMEKELLLQENQDKLFSLKGMKDALSSQSQFIRMIHKDPSMLPDEKRQLIDQTYMMMIEISRQGNEMVEEFRKAVGE